MGKMADSAQATDFQTNDETRKIMLSYTNVIYINTGPGGNDDANCIQWISI